MFFSLQIQNIVARLFLVLENSLLECCIVYSGYGSKAFSGLGATEPIACRLAGALLWNKMNGVDLVVGNPSAASSKHNNIHSTHV